MDIGTLLFAAGVFMLLSVLSLLVKNEGARGLGRVSLGLSISMLGFYVMAGPVPASITTSFTYLTWGFVASGLITALLGYRKFKRRNAESAPAAPATK